MQGAEIVALAKMFAESSAIVSSSAAQSRSPSMSIKQSIQFKAPAARVFDLLVSAELFAEMTEAPAQIDAAPGGTLSLFGGHIEGTTLETIANTSVRQHWRSKDWPSELVSTVSFALTETDNSTTLEFEHDGFPESMREHLEAGWHKMYWEPTRAFLAKP